MNNSGHTQDTTSLGPTWLTLGCGGQLAEHTLLLPIRGCRRESWLWTPVARACQGVGGGTEPQELHARPAAWIPGNSDVSNLLGL